MNHFKNVDMTNERFEEIYGKLREIHAKEGKLGELFTLALPDETLEDFAKTFTYFCYHNEGDTAGRKTAREDAIEKIEALLSRSRPIGRSSFADMIESLEEYDEASVAYKKALMDKYLPQSREVFEVNGSDG